jgi:hypothetical protein
MAWHGMARHGQVTTWKKHCNQYHIELDLPLAKLASIHFGSPRIAMRVDGWRWGGNYQLHHRPEGLRLRVFTRLVGKY